MCAISGPMLTGLSSMAMAGPDTAENGGAGGRVRAAFLGCWATGPWAPWPLRRRTLAAPGARPAPPPRPSAFGSPSRHGRPR